MRIGPVLSIMRSGGIVFPAFFPNAVLQSPPRKDIGAD
jgi:hypothetical protein